GPAARSSNWSVAFAGRTWSPSTSSKSLPPMTPRRSLPCSRQTSCTSSFSPLRSAVISDTHESDTWGLPVRCHVRYDFSGLSKGPLVAVPHWRAPTWERTKFYYDALEAGGSRYLVVDDDELPDEARGLLLTGGVDVDPRLYGEKRSPLTDRPNRQRDVHELGLLRQALERDLPVLCICRGHELLNVALGGSLVQNIESDEHRWHEDGTSNWHDVVVDRKSTRLNSSHVSISYAVFCLKKKNY